MTSISKTVGPTITSTIRPSIGFPSGADPILATDHPNLVAMYTMDNISGATLVDETANSNDGTISGAVAVAGQIDNALDFTASFAKVAVPKLTSAEGAYSFWGKQAGATHLRMYGIGHTANDNDLGFITLITDGTLTVGHTVGAVAEQVTSVTAAGLTGFHHFVASFSGGVLSLYIDAVSSAKTQSLGTNINPWPHLAGTTNTSLLGVLDKLSDFQGDGIADQFRYFNRGLTQAEVTALFNEGAP